MPKEIVYGDQKFMPGSEDDPAVVVVGWSREAGDVQVVTRLLNAEVPHPDECHDEGVPVKYGMYVNLDRRGINDLIRHLRRARDQAFGRDE